MTVTRRSFLAGLSAAVAGWRADASAHVHRIRDWA
ncbi:MAG: twin-arginine translocation signal domain-containing protein [Vicinamibacterales bacterium]|nr:twin-arginine translocation signal domain-containing protein [Vicinamibacterales bacterium]